MLQVEVVCEVAKRYTRRTASPSPLLFLYSRTISFASPSCLTRTGQMIFSADDDERNETNLARRAPPPQRHRAGFAPAPIQPPAIF